MDFNSNQKSKNSKPCTFPSTSLISKRRNFGDTLRQIFLCTLTIFVIFVGYPLVFLLFLPILIYRYAVEQLAKKSDQNFGPTLKGLDAFLSAHTPYTNPTTVLLPLYLLDRPVDRTNLIEIFNQKVIQLRDQHGNLIYERLKQKIVAKYGYNFWYKVDTFNLEDHIKFLDESFPERVVKHEELMNLTCELSKRSFEDPNLSPWELILIPKFKHDKDSSIKSVLIMRFHHGLCDGFSILKILERLGDKPWKVSYISPKSFSSSKQTLIQSVIVPTLRLLIEGPYETLKTFLFSDDDNGWINKAVLEPQDICSTQQTDLISLGKLKSASFSKLGEKLNVASTVISIVIQATVRAMARKGVKGNLSKLHVVIPWPLSNHPGDGLCNHWASVKIPIYVDHNDVRNTVQNVSREYNRLRLGIIPQTSQVITSLIGCLPPMFIPKVDSLMSSTCLLSNFPGPGHSIDICGSEVKDIFVNGKPTRGCAVASLSLSYNGQISYMIGGDKCNVSQDDANFLAEECLKIVQELQT